MFGGQKVLPRNSARLKGIRAFLDAAVRIYSLGNGYLKSNGDFSILSPLLRTDRQCSLMSRRAMEREDPPSGFGSPIKISGHWQGPK
jgi:hypothetical protein